MNEVNAPEQPAACCGGPAPQEMSACCVQDADAKAAGQAGCGCAAPRSAEANAPVSCCG